MVTKFAVVSEIRVNKSKSLPHGQFEAILSTGDLDRHGEVVSQTGIKVPKRTIRMYYNHQTYGDHLPIGQWVRIWKSDGKTMGVGQVDLEDEFAVKVYKKIQNGLLDSISIGFIGREFDGETSTWTKTELMEASVVSEAANEGAQVTAKELGFTEKDFEQSLKTKLEETEEKTALQRAIEEIDQIESEDELKAVYEVLKAKTAAVGIAIDELAQNPTESTVQRVRFHLRSVSGSVDTVRHILKVKYKENSND